MLRFWIIGIIFAALAIWGFKRSFENGHKIFPMACGALATTVAIAAIDIAVKTI